MDTDIDLCFLCSRDYDCSPVNETIVSQVKYVLPEITIIKLGVPLRICPVCDGAVFAFSKFKLSSVESSRRLETSIKGALSRLMGTQSRSLGAQSRSLGTQSRSLGAQSRSLRAQSRSLGTQSRSLHTGSQLQTMTHQLPNPKKRKRFVLNRNPEKVFIKKEKKEFIRKSIDNDTDSKPGHSQDNKSEKEETDKKIKPKSENTLTSSQKPHRQLCLPCKFCKKIFIHEYDLNKHMALHNGIKNFPCFICKKRFFTNRSLKQHVILHSEQKENNIEEENFIDEGFPCPICNKKFKKKYYLINIHMPLHAEEKKYKCEICNKTFMLRHYLREHLKTHFKSNDDTSTDLVSETVLDNLSIEEKRDFECFVCKQKFKRKYQLYTHVKTHEGYQDYKCEFCGQKFSLKHHLKNHIEKAHSTITLHLECILCDITFEDIESLREHMSIHPRTQWCTICGKLFRKRGHLSTHMLTHTGERKFKCNICARPFAQKHHLDSHLTSHSDVRQFQCELCDAAFKRKYTLIKHMKAMHSS